MRILEINEVPYGSTGGIAYGIANAAMEHDITVDVAVGYSRHPIKEKRINTIRVGGLVNKSFHMLVNILLGIQGVCSFFPTIELIKKCKKNRYDIIHLHNIHGCFINVPILMRYIKKSNIPVVWTLHDCWAFTGGCSHFIREKCENWKTGCNKCHRNKSRFDNVLRTENINYALKENWFSEINNLVIVTPSQWLKDLLPDSFLSNYESVVINNGINLEEFNKVESDFRKKKGLEDKYVILGVAMGWTESKGIETFIKLAEDLGDKYRIVLVGELYNRKVPENIINIGRTEDQSEIAKIYSAADLFVNSSYEESFGLVNIESLACGTPVVTYEAGGAGESIDESVGCIIETNDYHKLLNTIIHISQNMNFSEDDCIERAKKYSKDIMQKNYIDLYFRIKGNN